MRIKALVWYVLVAASGLGVLHAGAQEYPSKSIRLIVPYPPGGQADIIARLVGQKLSEEWRQPIVVDNRRGANSIIGMELTARSVPDGYTLVIGTTAMVINPAIVPKLPYDTVRDFAPITNVASTPFILVTHPSVPATSVKDLIALAKARPGTLTFGSGGIGSPTHLSGELLKSMAGIDMVHAPFTGGGASVIALLSGQIDVLFGGPLAAVPHVKSGKMRAHGVTSLRRFPALPDIPTISEAGLRGYESGIWFGLLAPAGTPRGIVSKLHDATTRILANPDVRKRFEAIDATVIGDTPEEFSAFITAELTKWSRVGSSLNRQ